jgi:multidrug efflux pump subunit AcrA (membrane-fusion protein)
MFARASIETGSVHEVLVAPESAIYEVDGKQMVFVPAGRGRIRILRPTDQACPRGKETVEIIAGLKQGDQVVAKGGLALKSLLVNKTADSAR